MAASTLMPDGARIQWHADLSDLEPLIEKTESCWLWMGAVSSNGYGRLGNGYAHRLAYEAYIGPIPSDRPHIDHLCRVRRCVNPEHLEAVTQAENNRRAAAVRPERTTCKLGHPLVQGRTQKFCRVCRQQRSRDKDRMRGAIPRVKLTAEQVGEIRRSADRGSTAAVLAARFGVSESHVRNIVRGLHWQEVG